MCQKLIDTSYRNSFSNKIHERTKKERFVRKERKYIVTNPL